MKQLIWLMLLALPFSVKSQPPSEGIRWMESFNWEQVKDKARKENKLIFIDVYTTWCAPCKKMDKEVYTDDSVSRLINSKFISIRIQMDETDKDNMVVKSWRPFAQSLHVRYGIDGYPSFLFLDSSGKLLHKGLGFKNVQDFEDLTKDAVTDPEARYKKLVNKFRSGELEFQAMPGLAKLARNKRDLNSAKEIARVYKEEYLDKQNNNEVFTRENLDLFATFPSTLLKSNERYFQFFYKQPVLADSIMGKQNAEKLVIAVIDKEEIVDKIYNDGKPIIKPKPKWRAIRNSVMKYGKKYYDVLFPDAEIYYYDAAKDWSNYVRFVNQRVKKYPPKKNGHAFGPQFGDAWALNHCAWNLFLHCDSKKLLKKALAWSNFAVELEAIPEAQPYYMDTKANLLFKMEKVKEAIALQEKVVQLTNGKNKDFIATLEKMKAGVPTWPINQ